MPERTLPELRHELHRRAELAGAEHETAALIRDELEATDPAEILTGLGGAGIAAVYAATASGPTILLRAELDALPMEELLALDYASERTDAAHKCGHDGHMAILCGVARELRREPLRRGRVILLFQPAEETGEGAARVLADERASGLRPDWAFALHNLPGYARGALVVRAGTFACGSRGLSCDLKGVTSHAAEPERGRSPALAVAGMIQAFSALPQLRTGLYEHAKATVIHARLGESAFGTSPGEGRVELTLRADAAALLDRLEADARALAEGIARTHGLEIRIRLREPFPPTRNHPGATEIVRAVARGQALPIIELEHPFGWSEDFGHFTERFPGALIGLGAGRDHPALHHPGYDFPDELLAPAVGLWSEIIARIAAS